MTRRWFPLLIAIAMGAGLGGCGGSSGSAPVATTARTTASITPEGAPGSVSAGIGSTVPLGISPRQLEGRLGRPAVPLRAFEDGLHCSLYRITEEPPFVKLRYCFVHGRLKFFSTYAVEGSSR